MIFIFLDYNEIQKTQELSVLDIVESRVCNLCLHNSTSFFTSKINIFIFKFTDPETLDYHYYFADRPIHIILPPARTTNN